MISTPEIILLVAEFNNAKARGASHEHLNRLADEIQKQNMYTYGIDTPFVSRRNRISEFELSKWQRLKSYVRQGSGLKLLESAFGSGRDLFIAQNCGYDVYGCELSEFLYEDLISKCQFDSSKVVRSDLRYIPFGNQTFDVIRHNASFLHMPLIGSGYTAHKCLEESFRLLKEDGCLYIYTKEGNGFVTVDTLDGLGARSFQLYDENTLGKLLSECGFVVKQFYHYNRERNGQQILWIEAFAYKYI